MSTWIALILASLSGTLTAFDGVDFDVEPQETIPDRKVELLPLQKRDVMASSLAAEIWLKIIDNGNYGGSWDVAALKFRTTIKRDQWVDALNKIRKPLGKNYVRTMTDQKVIFQPPGLPEGKYVVFTYYSRFGKKDPALETLTMVQGVDGRWRVLNYEVH